VALLELKGFGVSHGATSVAGVDLVVEPASMLAVVGRGEGAVSLLGLALAGLLPKGATTEGSSSFTGKRVLYLDRDADASDVVAGPELIVADEPGRGRDPATQFALLQALQAASQTAAVIIFSADFRLALSMGLEVAVIAGGKLLLKAPASQIAELPQYDTVRHLVGGARLRTRTLMRPPIGEPMLELDGVTKVYRRGLPRLGPPPVVALSGIGFAVRQGEVVGILGPPSAGKSTLLRLIAGLETPSAGHIGRRDGLVGYVFSDPRRAFNPTLPVGVSLTEPLRVEQTLLVEEQADRLVEVVRAVGLEPELLARLPGELGVAELQRMALARALAGRPNLLLLDDPTAYLDPAELREFLVLFARVRADFGLTAIVTSREFEVLRAVADRLLVLEGGHFVEGGKPAELAEAPKEGLTRRLVSVRYPGRFVAPVVETVVAAEAVALEELPAVAPDTTLEGVDAPSTSFAGPPPPLRGGGPTPPSVAEQAEVADIPATIAQVAAQLASVLEETVAVPVDAAAPSTTLPSHPAGQLEARVPVYGGGAPQVSAAEQTEVTAALASVLDETVAGPVDVAAPSTSFAGPPPPLRGGGPPPPSAAEQGVITDTPGVVTEADPEAPVHGLSATIVIAPVVLAEPVAVVVAEAVAGPAEPVAPQENLLIPLPEPLPEVEPAVTAPVSEQSAAEQVAAPAPDGAAEGVAVELDEPLAGQIDPVPSAGLMPEPEPTPASTLEPAVEAARPLVAETVGVIAADTVVIEVPAEPVVASTDGRPAAAASMPVADAEPTPVPPEPAVEAAQPVSAETVDVVAAETVAVEVAPEPVVALTETVPVPEAAVEGAQPLAAEAVDVVAVETVTVEVAPEPVVALTEAVPVPGQAAAEVAETLPTPAPDGPPPEVQAAETVVPSGEGADEAGEGGELEGAVEGLVDAAGSVDAPRGDAGR